MEVILSAFAYVSRGSTFLHVSGGDPQIFDGDQELIHFSPRKWRWSLAGLTLSFTPPSFLHVSGGDPHEEDEIFTSIAKENARKQWTEYPRSVLKAVGLAYSYCDLITFLYVSGGDPSFYGF